MMTFERDQPYPIHMPEGVQLTINAAGIYLQLGYSRPTSAEIADVRTGVIQFVLIPLAHSIVLAYRIGQQPWSDATFCIGRLDETDRQALLSSQALTGGHELMRGVLIVHVHLVDTSSNITRALRATTLTRNQSSRLIALLTEQAQLPWTAQDEQGEQNALFSRYDSGELPNHPDAIH